VSKVTCITLEHLTIELSLLNLKPRILWKECSINFPQAGFWVGSAYYTPWEGQFKLFSSN